jgi:hypothetical protein
LKSYSAAADAYRKGIEASAADAYRKGIEAWSSETSLLSQLWVNFGYAFMGSGPNPVRNIQAAVEAMREGVKLADDPRMEVDARVGLSTALLNSDATNPKRFEDAEAVLNEAWSLAQSDRSVPHKSRSSVMRNLGVVHVLQEATRPRGIRELDAAIEYDVSHFTFCHPLAIEMFEYCMTVLANFLPPIESVARAVGRLQRAERQCRRGSQSWRRYADILVWTLNALGPLIPPGNLPEIKALSRAGCSRGGTTPAPTASSSSSAGGSLCSGIFNLAQPGPERCPVGVRCPLRAAQGGPDPRDYTIAVTPRGASFPHGAILPYRSERERACLDGAPSSRVG